MTHSIDTKVLQLIEKGVRIPAPASVEIGETVSVDRISGKGVVIHAGSRLRGRRTLIMDDAVIGEEAPATVDNCALGPAVRLKGGYFSGAVFLKGAVVGSSAHCRPGTILEEKASAAHAVGLKQSILFPYVTLGSLINFCDVMMGGGTGPKDHSEVGSAYIHFNFTPNQDKATASLLGDVPRGVMLDQPPIFLGGQGGLVGPCRLAFGTVIAAGAVYRKDEFNTGRLLTAGGARGGSMPYAAGIYRSVKRIVANNAAYLGNLAALGQWYAHARKPFIGNDFSEALWTSLTDALSLDTAAHLRQFAGFVTKIKRSRDMLQAAGGGGERLMAQHAELIEKWPELHAHLERLMKTGPGDAALRSRFLERLATGIDAEGADYLKVVHNLDEADRALGRQWLDGVVDAVTGAVENGLPTVFGRV